MERLHRDGLFQAVFSDRAEPFMYRLKIESHEGHQWEIVDPYRFGPVLTDFDLHLLGEGTHLATTSGWVPIYAPTRGSGELTTPSGLPMPNASA